MTCRRFLGAWLLLLVLLLPVQADEKKVTAWRIFVSDHERGVVSVIDPVARKKIASFAIDSPASLYRTASGRTVFAVQRGANKVAALATGISFHDHGDHADIEVKEPRLLSVAFQGAKPSHFVEHASNVAIFFDGDGKAVTTTESAVLEGTEDIKTFDSGAPHHGAAAVFAGHTLITEPHPQDPSELPIGVKVRQRSGEVVGELHKCPDLHGEASSGNIMVFACATGLLVVEAQGQRPQIAHLDYSGDLPPGKATTVVGGRGLQYFLGNYGPSAVVLIEPTEKQAFRLVELPTRRVDFAVDPIRAKFAYVFTEDGSLHQIDVLSGKLVQRIRLTEPYSMDGHWSDPRPRIAVVDKHIIVSDPLAGRLHLVERDSFQKTGEIAVAGKPFDIVSVGGTGTTHDGDHKHK